MRHDSEIYRGLEIRQTMDERDDCYWWEVSIFAADGRYLADYPPRVWCSNQLANVRKWIDDNWRLLNACDSL